MHGPELALRFSAAGGFRGSFSMRMNSRERKVADRQLHLAVVLFQEVNNRRLCPAAKRALVITKFHDGNRRLEIPLYSCGIILASLDDWRLKENGDIGPRAEGIRVIFAGLLDFEGFHYFRKLRLGLLERLIYLALDREIVAPDHRFRGIRNLRVHLLLIQLINGNPLLV